MSKIIVLRGNSGSGKTTVASLLQRKLAHVPILIGQDYIRRTVLAEKDDEHLMSDDLIIEVVKFGLARNKDVIIEGIFPIKNSHTVHKRFIDNLFELAQNNVHLYYFDVSFNETLRRHALKPNAYEFGEPEMKRWWREDDRVGARGELLINEEMSAEQAVDCIIKTANLF